MKTHATTIVLAAVLALFVAAPSTEAAASTDPDARGAKKNVRVRRQARQQGDREILREAAPRPQHPNDQRRLGKMSKLGQHAFDDSEGDSNEYVPLKSNDMATYMLTAEDANGEEALETSQFGEMSMANLDDGSSSAEDSIEVDAEMGIGLELPLDSAPLAEAAMSMPLEVAALSMPLEESAFSMPLEGIQGQDTEFGAVAVSDSKPSGPEKNEHSGPSGKADKDAAETPSKTAKPEDSKKPKGPKGGEDEAPAEEGAQPIDGIDGTVAQFVTSAGGRKSSALVASVVGALVLMW